jgi:ribosomal protein L17
MRHGKWHRHLGRPTDHRQALLRNLVTSLIEHGRIETTIAKAKTLQPIADKMITLAKRQDPHASNQLRAYLYKPGVVMPKVNELATRFATRAGGYTRVLRLGQRKGDAAPMALIEYIDGPDDVGFQMLLKREAMAMNKEQKPVVGARRLLEKYKLDKKIAKFKDSRQLNDNDWTRLVEAEMQRLSVVKET